MQVIVKFNDIDTALRTLKRKMQREGVFRAMRLKRWYEKKSEAKWRKLEESMKRRSKSRYG